MTRINSAINVKRLTDEHLLAEHREIKRLPHVLPNCRRGPLPDRFVLGTGHVRFFLDKMRFTLNRYNDIRRECLERGFAVDDFSDNWNDLPEECRGDYRVTKKEEELLVERISERLLNSKKRYWHYKGERISAEDAVKLLKRQ